MFEGSCVGSIVLVGRMTSAVAVAEGTPVVGTLVGIDVEVGSGTTGTSCDVQDANRKRTMRDEMNFFISTDYMFLQKEPVVE
jgi:hypothetical protein